ALAGRAVAPALADPSEIDALCGSLERIGPLRPPCDMPQAGLLALGELKRVMEPLAPAAEEDGLSVAPRFLQPEHVGVEAERLLRCRGQHLDVRELREQGCGH